MEVDGILNNEIADGTSTDQSGQTHLSSHVLPDPTDNLLTVDPITEDTIATDGANEGTADNAADNDAADNDAADNDAADNDAADNDAASDGDAESDVDAASDVAAVKDDQLFRNTVEGDEVSHNTPEDVIARDLLASDDTANNNVTVTFPKDTEDCLSDTVRDDGIIPVDITKHFSCEITSIQTNAEDDIRSDDGSTMMDHQAHQLLSKPVVRLTRILDLELLQRLAAENNLNEDLNLEVKSTSKEVNIKLEPHIECGGNSQDQVILQSTNEMDNKHLEKLSSIKSKMRATFNLAFPCYLCTERFCSITRVQSHGREQHGKELSNKVLMELVQGCPICGIKFQHGDTLRKHHARCQSGKSIPDKRKQSVTLVEEEPRVKSPKGVKNEIEIPTSIQADGEKDSLESVCFSCLICPRVFKAQHSLRRHLETTHKITPTNALMKSVPSNEVEIPSATCSVCKRTFSAWDKLYRHMKDVHRMDNFNYNSYPTNKSVRGKPKLSKFRIHPQNTCDRNAPLYSCRICAKKFRWRKSVSRHLQNMHQMTERNSGMNIVTFSTKNNKKTKPYCSTCNVTFANWQELCIHRKVHSRKQTNKVITNLQCMHCNISFRTLKCFHKHMLTCKNNIDAVVADVLDNVRSSRVEKEHSLLQGSVNLVYPCHLCGTILTTRSAIYKHLRTIHFLSNPVMNILPQADGPQLHLQPQCAYCEATFEQYRDLYKHLRMCEFAKPLLSNKKSVLKCKECCLLFQNEKQLQHHSKNIHLSQTPNDLSVISTEVGINRPQEDLVFPCNVCGRGMSSLSCLEGHMRGIHFIKCSGQVLIEGVPKSEFKHSLPKCNTCYKTFNTWKVLYAHMRKLHGTPGKLLGTPGKPSSTESHYCHNCGLSFRNSDRLQNHIPHCKSKVSSPQMLPNSSVEEECYTNSSTVYPSSDTEQTSGRRSIICEFCDDNFVKEDVWFQHLSEIHRMTEVKCEAMRTSLRVNRSESVNTSKTSHLLPLPTLTPSSASHSNEKYELKVSSVDDSHGTRVSCSQCKFTTKYPHNLSRHYTNLHNMSKMVAQDLKSNTSGAVLSNSTIVDHHSSFQPQPKDTKFPKLGSHSDTSSSDDDMWADCSKAIDSSSSESSDSDDDEIYKRTDTCRASKLLYSSSSLSSDDDVGLAKAVQLTDTSYLVDVSHSKTFIEAKRPLLTSNDILNLDEDIFLANEYGSKVMVANGDLCKSNAINFKDPSTLKLPPKSSAGIFMQTVASTDTDNPLDPKFQDMGEKLTASTHDSSVYYIPISSSSPAGSSGENTNVIDITDLATVETITDEDFSNILPNQNAETLESVCKARSDSSKASPHVINNSVKSPPIAVLRPFSGVPDVKCTDVASSSVPTSSGNRIPNRYSLSDFPSTCTGATSCSMAGKQDTLSTHISLGLNESTASTVDDMLPQMRQPITANAVKTLVSFPIFLVNTTDFIFPCIADDTYVYRRISFTMKSYQMIWYFAPWYPDFSKCKWDVIALLPEPLLYLDQLKMLMTWLLKNKIAGLSLPSKKIPRLKHNNWTNMPTIDMVTGYNTPNLSAICCFCARLVQNVQELAVHGSQEHRVCPKCNEILSRVSHMQHICRTGRIDSELQSKKILSFVRLSSPSSINCNLLGIAIESAAANISTFPSENTLLGQPSSTSISNQIIEKPAATDNVSETGLTSNTSMPVFNKTNIKSVLRKSSVRKGGLKTKHISSPKLQKNQKADRKKRARSLDKLPSPKRHKSAHVDPCPEQQNAMAIYNSNPSSRQYRCKFCHTDFLLWVEIEHHLQTLHMKCTLCKEYFKDRKERSDHITNSHNSFICLACDHTCSNNDEVKSHIMRTHVNLETGLFSCAQCKDEQIHPDSIVSHLEGDDAARNKKCSVCKLSLPEDKIGCLKHFFNHSLRSRVQYSCIACKHTFMEPWALKKHIKESHHGIACTKCLSTSKDCSLEEHTRKSDEVIKTVFKDNSTSCTLCWESFDKQVELRRHNNAEHSEYNLQCEVCGQRFKFGHQLGFHMAKHKKHKEREPLQYSLCTKCLRVCHFPKGDKTTLPTFDVTECCKYDVQSTAKTMLTGSAVATEIEEEPPTIAEADIPNKHNLLASCQAVSRPSSGSTSPSTNVLDTQEIIDSSSSSDDSPSVDMCDNVAPIKLPQILDPSAGFSCHLCSFSCNFQAALNKHINKKHNAITCE